MSTEASTGLAWRKVTVIFDGQSVTIRRAGIGRDTDRIPLAKITSVGWQQALGLGGHIEFATAGPAYRVRFSPWAAASFGKLRDVVEAAI